MNNFKSFLSAVAVVACASSAANAATYQFTFNGTSGITPGVIQGTFDLGVTNGTTAATNLTLTSIPASFGSLPEGNVATSWTSQFANSFTVSGGVITSFDFFAITGTDSSGTELCLEGGGNSYSGNGRFCGTGLNYLGDGSIKTSAWTYNAVTFSTPTVPVPAAAWLFGSGVIGLAGVARRKVA